MFKFFVQIYSKSNNDNIHIVDVLRAGVEVILQASDRARKISKTRSRPYFLRFQLNTYMFVYCVGIGLLYYIFVFM